MPDSPHSQLALVRSNLYDLFLVGYNIACNRVVARESRWKSLIGTAEEEAETLHISELIQMEVKEWAGEGFPHLLESAWEFLNPPEEDVPADESRKFLARLYAILKLIDRASWGACPWMGYPAPSASPWGQYGAEGYELLRSWYRTHRRLNSEHCLDRVVFRPKPLKESQEWWRKCQSMPEVYRAPETWRRQWIGDDFCALQVLRHYPDCPFDLQPKRLRSHFPPPVISSRPVLCVAVVPLVTALNPDTATYQPGELLLKISNRVASPARFTVTVSDESCANLCSTARRAIAECARREAQFVVFPELVVPDAVVKAIQDALKASKAEGKTMPELVVAGTWLREEDRPLSRRSRHFFPVKRNMAVVLDGAGNILDWKQSKMQAYTMSVEEQNALGLRTWVEAQLGRSDNIQEDILTVPRCLNLFETDQDRMAILICEDLAQMQPTVRALIDLPVTYVFSPVMAGDLAVSGGFGAKAREITETHAAVVVVGNFQGHIAALSRARQDPRNPPRSMNVGLVAQPFSRRRDPVNQNIQEGVVAPIIADHEIVRVISIPEVTTPEERERNFT